MCYDYSRTGSFLKAYKNAQELDEMYKKIEESHKSFKENLRKCVREIKRKGIVNQGIPSHNSSKHESIIGERRNIVGRVL